MKAESRRREIPGGGPPGTSKRRILKDRFARILVRLGGMGILASLLGILGYLCLEALPLLSGATVELSPSRRIPGLGPIADLLLGPYARKAVVLGRDGRIRILDLEEGRILQETPALRGEEGKGRAGHVSSGPGFSLVLPGGRIVLRRVEWARRFEEGSTKVDPLLGEETVQETGFERVISSTAVFEKEGGYAVLAQSGTDLRVVFLQRSWEINPLTEERTVRESRKVLESTGSRFLHLALNPSGTHAFGVTEDGRLCWWDLESGEAPRFHEGNLKVSALGILLGGNGLILGGPDGRLSEWFLVRKAGEDFSLLHARDFEPVEGSVRAIRAGHRNRGFLVASDTGELALYYGTTGRCLWRGHAGVQRIGALAMGPKDDAFLAGGEGGEIVRASFRAEHPEAGIGAFFGAIRYEGYDRPSYTWQSTGGSDDFEIKLSLVPLVFGTLKGTFFAMLFSIPLGILGAMFVSQFLHPGIRDLCKPLIEIMASIPSVILGFIAAVWLAPLVESGFAALLAAPVLIGILILGGGATASLLPRSFRRRFPRGFEVIPAMFLVGLGAWFAILLAPALEGSWFGGDFPGWVQETLKVPYEQRNAVIIALAMSFAVIPIIFSISEDAFANVPRSLVSASLALGASRWQTVVRVVLPTASPGIFSAVMIGLGRAIGETMIVLMATGNTPIMDWNPFNGFRTLSANIAVEIPEAPVGGTLYRTLFLSALLLFGLTFCLNTAAEVVRLRLRRRYAEL